MPEDPEARVGRGGGAANSNPPDLTTITWGVVITGVIAYVAFATPPEHLLLRDIDAVGVAKLMSPFLLISLLIERSLEVWLTALQGPGQAQLDLRLAEAKRRSADPEELLQLEQRCARHKEATRKLAWRAGLILGLAVALVGFRFLESIVGHDLFADLEPRQRAWGVFIDTIVTGAALGGGADGLHKPISLFTEYMDAGKRRLKAQGESATDH